MNVRFANDFTNIYKDFINIITFKVNDLIDNSFILSFFYFFIDCVIYDKVERSNIFYR